MSKTGRKILWVALFSIAMAYLESAIVVYLRRLYGIEDLMLQVPPFDAQIAAIEVGRELATLVMLLSIGWIAGHRLAAKLGYAVITFGLWDIFYYVWLRIFIRWPQSLLDPDLLFLVPLPWWGPVLAPVLVSLLMIAGGLIAVVNSENGKALNFNYRFWISLSLGVLTMLYAFMEDAISALPADAVTLSNLRPSAFNWPVFLLGLGLAIYSIWQINSKKQHA